MSILHHRKCLVLNKNWRPIGTIPLADAICKVFSFYDDGTPKAKILEPFTFNSYTWDDWSKLKPASDEDKIVSTNSYFKVPEIILLSKYEKMPTPKLYFSRKTLYKRDKMQCQYCSVLLSNDDLTIDHVVPRAQGGGTTWENCVACCLTCNRKKADRTPKQANMALLAEPKKPSYVLFNFDVVQPKESWCDFLEAKN